MMMRPPGTSFFMPDPPGSGKEKNKRRQRFSGGFEQEK